MRAFKFKPSRKVEQRCTPAPDVWRELCKVSVQERRDAWNISSLSLACHAQAIQFQIRAARSDVKEVFSQVPQDVWRRSDKAFDNFFARAELSGMVPAGESREPGISACIASAVRWRAAGCPHRVSVLSEEADN